MAEEEEEGAAAAAAAAAAVAAAMGMELTIDQLLQPIMAVQDMVPTAEAMVHMEAMVRMLVTLPLVMVVLYMELRMVPMGHMGVRTEVAHMVHLAAMVQEGMVATGELEAREVVGVRVVEVRAGTTHMENEYQLFTAGSQI